MPYCTKCGGEIEQEGAKCPRCGSGVIYRRPFESVEFHLKDVEARVEKIADDSTRFSDGAQRWAEDAGSWARGNRRWAAESRFANSLMNGMVVLWLGASLLLREYRPFPGSWWMWFLAGTGLILLARGAYAVATKGRGYRRFIYPGVILLVWGASTILQLDNWAAYLLVTIGAAITLTGLRRVF